MWGAREERWDLQRHEGVCWCSGHDQISEGSLHFHSRDCSILIYIFDISSTDQSNSKWAALFTHSFTALVHVVSCIMYYSFYIIIIIIKLFYYFHFLAEFSWLLVHKSKIINLTFQIQRRKRIMWPEVCGQRNIFTEGFPFFFFQSSSTGIFSTRPPDLTCVQVWRSWMRCGPELRGTRCYV